MHIKFCDRRIYGDRDFTDEQLQQEHTERRAKSRERLKLSTDDVAQMVDELSASRGITRCKAAYAALSPQYHL